MNWRHTDFQSVALPTELPRRQRHMLTHPFSPSIEPPLQCDTNPLTQSKHLYYIHASGPTPHVGPNQERTRSPMSRTSLHRPRRPQVVWDHMASGTRLFTCPLPPTFPVHIPHYKRCPKAHRLRLRSDQSLSLPVHVTGHGRFPDIFRQALSKGQCQVRAALTRRTTLALSDDAHEHGVKLLARAIVPRGSTVVALGEVIPHGDGRESTPPYLRMAGHFWWSRLPHTEIISRLFHVLSEARGCRKAGVDVEHPLSRKTPIGTGVTVFLRNRPGLPSPPPLSPLSISLLGTTGQSPRVWAPRMGRPHPSPHPRKEPPASPYPQNTHAHPFPSSGAPFPRKARNNFPRNNQIGTSF